MFYRILAMTMLCPLGLFAQAPPADPQALPARDAHQDLSIAADPYISADRYNKERFGKKSPYDAGIVAIEVYFRNDNDAPIRLDLATLRLVVTPSGGQRQQLEALSPEEVTDRTLLKAHANPSVPRLALPIPLSKSGKGKAWDEMAATLRSVALTTDILPPHAATHGFLFFDMNHEFDAIHHSQLYIPDLSFMTNHKALFFFEIELSTAPTK
jgi:hypothetical protein